MTGSDASTGPDGSTGTDGSTSTDSGTGKDGSTGKDSSTGTDSGFSDPVCTDPDAGVSQACSSCINGIGTDNACIQAAALTCEGNAGCLAYAECVTACVNAPMDAGQSDAGSCVQNDMNGDAGSPEQNCIACCQTTDSDGFDT